MPRSFAPHAPITLTIFAICLLAAVIFAPAYALQNGDLGFEEWDCPFPPIARITCGYLTVPEDRAQPDGYTVELAVAIISPLSANADPVPVVYLEGGPGGAPLISADTFLEHPLAENYMIILFDQRGTGFSFPSLNCPELEEDGSSGDPVAECRDRLLDEQVDLQMYNSAAGAADVADLVTALGYEQVNLWGISYGTKLGLTILRDYPQIVRSAVLDSVYAPETDDLQVQTTGFLGALRQLFDRCAADAACGAAYPDLEADFYALVNRLNVDPVTFDYDGEPITLDGMTLAGDLFQILYDTEAIPYLPYAITLLAYAETDEDYADGYSIISGGELPGSSESDAYDSSLIADSDMVLDYMDEYGDIEDSEGMAFSVDCQEEYQLDDRDAALRLAESAPEPLIPYLITSINSSLQDCAVWGVQTADPLEAQRVRSAVPTLLFAGMFDPVTPVSSAESALQGLSRGQLLVFPSAGHGITAADTASGACAKDLMIAFFDNPSAPLDTGCIGATSAIPFY